MANKSETRSSGPSVAAVVITKDEERNIADCLASVAWVDEIVVVDACSGDRTTDLARQFTDKVFVRPWPGFGPQKNFGMNKATADWVFILDADERVTDALREEIVQVLSTDPDIEIGGFEVPRRNFFYGQWVRGGGIYPDYQLRLFRRTAARYDETLLHERLRLQGRIERLKNPLDHYSMPSIRDHVRKMMWYTTLAAREKLKSRRGVTVLDLLGNHVVTMLKTYLARGGWRDGVHGVIVAGFAGMHTFVKYAKAWEMLATRERG